MQVLNTWKPLLLHFLSMKFHPFTFRHFVVVGRRRWWCRLVWTFGSIIRILSVINFLIGDYTVPGTPTNSCNSILGQRLNFPFLLVHGPHFAPNKIHIICISWPSSSGRAGRPSGLGCCSFSHRSQGKIPIPKKGVRGFMLYARRILQNTQKVGMS